MGGKEFKTFLITAVIFLVFMAIGLSIFFSFNLSKQRIESKRLNESLTKLQLNYDALKTNYGGLKNDCETTKKEYTSLNSSMKDTQLEVDKTLDRLEDFEAKVNESMSWFKKNNNIKGHDKYIKIKEQLKNCVDIKSDVSKCKIDLKCIYKTNLDNQISYKTDEALTGKDDFLNDLDSIYLYKGGDCEDLSLLFTAEYNFMIDECEKEGYMLNNTDALMKEIPVNGRYMYPVCGNFNPGGLVTDYAGHCVVALVASPIENSQDIYKNLKDGILIEPQSGEYLLDMNDTNEISLFDTGQIPNTMYHIYIIITDKDLKIFYKWGEEVEWLGYSDFVEDIARLRKSI